REVERQKELAALFAQAVNLYDQGRWEEAIAQLEKMRSLDPAYRTDAVTDHLFVSYLNDGREKLARAGTSTGLITQAIERFGSALAIRPFNRQASDERRLANLYYEAVQALNRQDWPQARTRLEAVRGERADYAGGQVTVLLYQAYVGLGDAALRAGNATQAKTFYELAAGLAVPDRSAAEDGLARVAIALATATPTTTPTAPTPAAIVATEALNVRSGPGVNFPVIGVLKRGDAVAVQGRTPRGDWLKVCCLAGGESGWLSASLVETSLPATAIPVVTEIPNTPTPQPTSTRTPTPPLTATRVPPTSVPPQPTNPPPPPPTHTPTRVPTATLPPPPTDTPTRVPTNTPPPPPTNTPTPPPR
ncbi:MAG: SH3 domain-containing protein, partial [Anaerolineae bacterium]|nr:SH3 domain-containing protein [Anaerolineae bacterium]